MDLQEKSIHTLELPKVLAMLADEASSDRAKEMCLELRPRQTLYECQLLQQQTAESYAMIGIQGSPPFSGLKDVSDALDRADKGGRLNPAELLRVAALLRSARTTKAYRDEHRNQDDGKSSIDELFFRLSGNRYLEDKITAAIISEEELSDHASSELYQIRRQIRTASSKVRDVLNKIVSSSSYSKMLQDTIITQRGGRFVVPVKAEHRGGLPGLVHDVSASGATLFVEPSQVVELNNNIRVLGGKEQAEIDRILAELSAEVAEFSGQTQADFDTLCALDFIFARGKLAYKMRADRPLLAESGQTRLDKARHPLLDRETAVPITFLIGGGTDTVIITGPNTGGKTVSIKTLGLLTLMSQCGLQIPVSGESRVVVRRRILADIGDEQSIEQSLSTFSSHMRNIVDILGEAGTGDMVLLDELGAGTDPVEGAAIAVAIIEHLRARGCTVAATTHYAELKVFALETAGVENASCEFDVATLMPTYRLVFGVPGKSNAFAISRRLGLSESVLAVAEGNLDSQNKQFEEVISKLEEKRQALESKIAEAERQVRDAEEMRRKAEDHLENLDRDREKLMTDTKKQAQDLLSNARAASEHVLTEARRLKKDAEDGGDPNLTAARKAFQGELNKAEDTVRGSRAERKPMPLPRALKAGDTVEIVATRTKGIVLETPGGDGKVKLQAGILKITVGVDEIQLVSDKSIQQSKPQASGHKLSAPSEAAMRLDLRGMNGDEGIMEIDRFIDHAVRQKLETVTIIHGKGTGALRQRVQSHLKAHSQVKSFRLGAFGEGENGVTVVTLKK